MQSALKSASPYPQGGALTQDHELLQALPTAVYTTDAAGSITFYNEAAARLWGHRPKLGSDEWCGSWRLFWPDGTPLPHDQCPMATALKEQRPISGAQAVCERKDGTRISFLAFPRPLRDSTGSVIGAINTLVDVTSLKTAEDAVRRRAQEQTALYRFTDNLYRASSLPDIYNAALDAILETLGCRSASILRFDHAGVMRFVAWRGLSEGYRRAVDGHSPWQAGERNPEPIFIDDVDKAVLPASLRETIRAEGIQALAFIPITSHGETIGKFMTYYDAPRAFDRETIELAVTVARQLGFSLERTDAETSRRAALEALRESEERLRAVFNSSAVGVAILTPDARFIEANDAFSEISGYSGEELRSRDSASLTHPDDCASMQAHIDKLLAGSASSFVIEKRYRRKDGSTIWVQNSVSLTHDDAGRPLHLVKLVQNITERKTAEKRQRLLVDELNHRVKNTLATVQSFAVQTLRSAPSIAEGRKAFEARLIALSKTHDVLTRQHWEGADVREVIDQAIAAYRGQSGAGRFRIDGPELILQPKAALALSLALHELATNAAKYGALSNHTGGIDIEWKVTPQPRRFRLRWAETGGPKVEPPGRRGFGSRLVERGLSQDLAGDVRLDFATDGVMCSIDAPLHEVAGAAR
jgi:PAS domain S-box-containing protein